MIERLRYGDDPSQWADLYLPEESSAEAGLPVCVVVHGGFWRERYHADLGAPLARDLSGAGLAALNVEYRRVGCGGGWPTSCTDVAAAVDALAGVALDGVRLDLTRVVGLGHSAGGHLVGWLAGQAMATYARGGVALSGAVCQAGVLDLEQAVVDGLGDGAVLAFLGEHSGLADVAQASPIRLLPTGIRTVLVHGDADADVPVTQSQRYQEAAAAAGDDCTLEIMPGEEHFGVITVGSHAWDICREAVVRLVA